MKKFIDFNLINNHEKNVVFPVKGNENVSNEEKKFYFNLASFALSKFDLNYINLNGGYDCLLNKAIEVFCFLDFYCEKNFLKGGLSKLDEISILLEKKLKMGVNERDLAFMQNEFSILNKNGDIINRKLDLVVFGNHNNNGHSATSFLVGTPAGIVAQMILDGKIKERGVMNPVSEVLGETVLKELEKMKVFVTEEKTMKAKF